MKIKSILLLALAGTIIITGILVFLSLNKKHSANNDQNTPSVSDVDSTSPKVSLNIPDAALNTLDDKKVLTVSVQTSDNKGVTHVEYLLDGQIVARSENPPYQVEIDVTKLGEGQHTLKAVAYDAAGNSQESEVFTFTITNTKVVPANQASQDIIRRSTSHPMSGTSGSNPGPTGDSGSSGGGDDGDALVTWPSAPPAQICGNSTMLNGPATAPAGAVTVNVGDNVQNLTNSNPAGTTFWLKPGTHTFNYSIIPKDGDTYIGAPGAIIDGGGTTGIAFWEEFYGAKAKNVTLSYLTLQNFTSIGENQGSIYAGDGWKINHSTLKNHGYVAMFAGPNNSINYNCFDSNGQLGIGTFRFEGGNTNITIDHNEFKNNNTRGMNDCGCAGGTKFWSTSKSRFTNNWVHDNKSVGAWADNNNIEILFEGNYIADNDNVGIFYEISYNFMIRYNYIARNTIATGVAANDAFPNGGIYISEAGGVEVPGFLYGTSEIHDNYLKDNWDGIAIWQSGNRYVGSDEYSTDPPDYGDPYRWKSQNIQVYNNEFHLDKAAIDAIKLAKNLSGASCAGNNGCGRNTVISDWVAMPGGPAGDPNTSNNQYQLSVSFSQNNVYHDNKYYGDWNFMSYDQGTTYSWTTWRNPKPNPLSSFVYYAPGSSGFAQDSGSTFEP